MTALDDSGVPIYAFDGQIRPLSEAEWIIDTIQPEQNGFRKQLEIVAGGNPSLTFTLWTRDEGIGGFGAYLEVRDGDGQTMTGLVLKSASVCIDQGATSTLMSAPSVSRQ